MLINELRQRLFDLDATISHHESIVQDLKQQRADVLSQLAFVVYPVLTLPTEITTEIFKWCYEAGLRLLPSVAPLLLTRVCRDWRELALSTPALWDTIDEIEFDDPLEDEDFICKWFSRAGTRPLSFGIIYPEHLESQHLESVIHRHASQLQWLDVMTHLDILSDFGTIQPFPILSDLSLCSMSPHEPIQSQIDVFCHAPSLRHLSLECLPPSALNLPWAQLTKTTLSFVSLTECLDFLRLATSLREFRRAGPPAGEEDESVLGRSPLSHSSLTSLAVSTSSGDEGILQLLTVPGLQTLELGGRWTIFTDLDIVLVPFFSRTCITLRALIMPLPTRLPVHWFQLLTHLTTLELVHPVGLAFSTGAIRALDRRTAPDFLPKLHTLVLSQCGSNRIDSDLLEVLVSRCDVSDAERARLESFSLIWPKFEIPDDSVVRLPLLNVGPLRALAARGMRIHIGTRSQNSFY
ncbi:hypothetical protein B0H13DRAFT_2042943 [Mycena leptocephala]|nr:hypothetical protein B0H13DRAFT_2042943 [Mycena leptocephala]